MGNTYVASEDHLFRTKGKIQPICLLQNQTLTKAAHPVCCRFMTDLEITPVKILLLYLGDLG